ncbi:MAG: site-specific DNA-methyltransferase, partial [Bacteroidetes bacterium]|nr:site-specific DNA-methyltransferase [Bacteroidota bacterium]
MPTLQFKGKSVIWNHHLSVPYHTLEEDKKLSFQAEKGEGNLIIEGDNLLALKALLPQYSGKVKCIYIDPPYNTGKEAWVYNDNVNSPLINDWIGKEVGVDDLTRHDKWLCMMVPRLKLLRDLLADDGTIFVSIDDNEVQNLRPILNEVFGEDNFYSQIIVRANSRGQTYKQIAKTHEYLVAYTKRSDTELGEIEKGETKNDLEFKDDIGSFNLRELRNRNPKFGKHNRPNLFYPIYVNRKTPDRLGHCMVSLDKQSGFDSEILPFNSEGKESCWRWGKSKAIQNLGETTLTSNLIAKRKADGSFGIYEKYRKTTYKPKSIWEDNSFLTETGTVELRELGLGERFDFPKPVGLIRQIVSLSTDDEDIVLDSYAGSGTTMQAVMDLNKEDGGNRKCILVQMTEATEKEPKKNICKDITQERVRRAIKKDGYESGFRYFSVGEAIDAETMLSGKLPTFTQLAKYVYYLCTGSHIADEKKIDEKSYYVGSTGNERIYLVYDKDYDKLTHLALNLDLAKAFLKESPGKKIIVYAPACFLDEEYMAEKRIEFVSVPYNLFTK